MPLFSYNQNYIGYNLWFGTHVSVDLAPELIVKLDALPEKVPVELDPESGLQLFKVDADTWAFSNGPQTPGIQFKRLAGRFIALNNMTADQQYLSLNNPESIFSARFAFLCERLDMLKNISLLLAPELAASEEGSPSLSA